MAKIVYNKRRRTELWLVLGVLFGLFSIGYMRTVNGLLENNETITTLMPLNSSARDTSFTSTTISSSSAVSSLETTTVNTITEKKIIDRDEGMFVIFQSILVLFLLYIS